MYFSVRTPMKILSKVYHPCICYELPEELELTVDKLVSEGKAYKFKNVVHFQNGKINAKDEAAEKAATATKTSTRRTKTTKKVEDNNEGF